jgi:hypothetical protein
VKRNNLTAFKLTPPNDEKGGVMQLTKRRRNPLEEDIEHVEHVPRERRVEEEPEEPKKPAVAKQVPWAPPLLLDD